MTMMIIASVLEAGMGDIEGYFLVKKDGNFVRVKDFRGATVGRPEYRLLGMGETVSVFEQDLQAGLKEARRSAKYLEERGEGRFEVFVDGAVFVRRLEASTKIYPLRHRPVVRH